MNALTTLEQRFFRNLNKVVEPAVRRGVGSPGFSPAALIVLESTGFKSGAQRRTPLLSVAAGPYRVVSTVRGDRSFWVKNLINQPRVNYFISGNPRAAQALVITGGELVTPTDIEEFPLLSALVSLLRRRSRQGTTFAVLLDD
ncbi:MAG: hypothetical protein Hals2KO_16360 [Halioglobus sp.]